MEEFIDSLSKRLAKAVSRRDMLRIASGAIFSVVATSTGISRVWARGKPAPACRDSAGCGAVQNTIQLTVGNDDPTKYKDHHDYVKAAERAAHVAVEGELIDRECAECIVRQFRDSIPVASQYPCGTSTAPNESCSATNPSNKQIKAASELALSAAPNAWGDATQWAQLTQLAEAMLGCTLASADSSASVGSPAEVISKTSAALLANAAVTSAAATTCAQTGVNYCGPGNSADPAYPLGKSLPTVAPCLNEACCKHDNCYAKVCEQPECYFTSNTECDNPLLATCLGYDACSSSDILNSAATQFVCTVVVCLELPAPGTICEDVQTRRANPACSTPCTGSSCCPSGTTCTTAPTVVAGSITGVCCPPGNTACELTCCPTGATCVNGVCGCPPGQVLTGGQCTCPAGESLCGTNCCSAGATCLNGVCSKGACSPDPCLPGQVCCVNPQGEPFCNPAGSYCCPQGFGACAVGTTCCGVSVGGGGFQSYCCSSGQSCFTDPAAPGAVCCPAGYTGCAIPGVGSAWCCSSTTSCSTTQFGGCN